jgi:23S rRNA (guanosine2251-2'-O)-methyltransferase
MKKDSRSRSQKKPFGSSNSRSSRSSGSRSGGRSGANRSERGSSFRSERNSDSRSERSSSFRDERPLRYQSERPRRQTEKQSNFRSEKDSDFPAERADSYSQRSSRFRSEKQSGFRREKGADFRSERFSKTPSRSADHHKPKPQQTQKVPKGGELIYGIHPIIELLKAKRRKINSVYTTNPTPKAWDQIAALLPSYVPVNYVTRESLFNIAQTTDHQGVVAWAQPFVFRRKFFEVTKQKNLVMLDGIQDSRNLGAIIRSAYCTNADGIIIINKGGAPLNASAIKSSAGLAEHVEIYQAPSAYVAAQELKKAGYTIYLATFKGESALTVNYQQPMCMVIGGEGFGISRDIFDMGIHVTLPQKTTEISYNASVAAGILLFLAATKNKTI